ncbi:MAG: DUF418 domain-containing protein [Acidobacteria bacterium]|nr:DUF418 domain-containing protein [Acidobacteriota bacterium]MYF15012.1 DUF418 domain-containing protein [Acidobacteriota bacterium]MYI97506.1 DUF418 domain-containing protein [Acidobacteriota bacterium]
MNIQIFSMPEAAYQNPTAFGDLTGINLGVWTFAHVFFSQKFLSLFSMLFGAGVCLFADRIEARGGRPAKWHYRRMGWLLAFGLAHAYLLWAGDILVIYAICGFLVVLFRRRRPRTLLIAGLASLAVTSLFTVLIGSALLVPGVPEDAHAEVERGWAPNAAYLDAEIAAYRGGWSEQQPRRAEQALGVHLGMLPFFALWFCGGLMLIGMALYKGGVLGAARDDRFYRRLVVIGLLTGLPLVVLGIWWNFAGGWAWQRSMLFGTLFNAWGCIPVALAYLGLVMLAVRRGFLPALQARLAAVGRMAFTNYLLQTVLCTTIFYGHGLGLFASVERYQQLLIALAVWALQLWLSPIWMRRYAYGPLEWLWRTLTYGRLPNVTGRSSAA